MGRRIEQLTNEEINYGIDYIQKVINNPKFEFDKKIFQDKIKEFNDVLFFRTRKKD